MPGTELRVPRDFQNSRDNFYSHLIVRKRKLAEVKPLALGHMVMNCGAGIQRQDGMIRSWDCLHLLQVPRLVGV